MAYRRNDRGNDRGGNRGGRDGERGRVVDFRDGQPVYGNGGSEKRGAQDGEKRPYGQKRYGAKRGEDENAAPRRTAQHRRGGENKNEAEYPFRSAEEQARGKGEYRNGARGERRMRRDESEAGAAVDKRHERRFARAEAEAEAPRQVREDELPYILMGRNAVKEAIKSGRSIDRILVQSEPDGSLREILSLARDRQLQIREVDRAKLDEMCMPFGHGNKTGNHQGIVAQVPGVQYCELSDILAVAKERNEAPFVILLDGIEDPYNLGSILRSAECAGAHGVVIPKRRAAGVTSAACKAAAGAAEYVKVAQVSNLSGAIERLKDAGLWIAGADMAGAPMGKADFSGALGLVIGSEGKGISELVKKNCDFLVRIPLRGKIDSLNASVAAAVLMYEKLRCEEAKAEK